jgi:GAF domain-containing protein
MDTLADLSSAITTAARTINHQPSLKHTLQTIVEVARDSVPGFDQVGISSLFSDGRIVTEAYSGELVPRLDEVQYSLGEGPCVDTLRGSEVVAVPCIRHEQRWPRYVPQAVELGIRSQLAVRLYLDEEGTLGGINFYSTTSDDVDPDAEALARLFGAHAAIALGHVQEREHLNEALHSRKVIGQAIGILMERYQMDEDRAFAFLVRASSHGNVKLRQVAQELVDECNRRRPGSQNITSG